MSAFYCHDCDNYVDLDFDAEHYDECPLVTERKEEEAAAYWLTISSPEPTPGLWRRLKCFLGFHGPLDVHEWKNRCECRSCGYTGLAYGEFDLI